MKQLIKIQANSDGNKMVSARDLYVRLGYADRQFSRWATKNIQNNPFIKEGLDWAKFDIVSNGNLTCDYTLTLDCAKNLCMLSRTTQGQQIRDYFIEVEKMATVAVLSQLPNNPKIEELEAKYNRLAALVAQTDISEFSIFDYSSYCGKRLYGSEATTLGKRATKRCREQGLPIGQIRDVRFGMVNTYPETVLHDIFSEFFKQPRF